MDLPLWAFLVSSISASGTLGAENEGCQSPQYIQIGRTGVIRCTFRQDFYGLLWYDSSETNLEVPFLQIIDNEKSGYGYDSGKYDAFQNGSLIINNVSSIHNQTFTVLKFASSDGDPVSFSVDVITTDTLGAETEGCQSPQYIQFGGTGVIHCTFRQDFYGVLWFDSSETNLEVPFLKLINSHKSGYGYDSDKYDVFQNGSLIIKNVSSIHDQTFTALEFATSDGHPVSFLVDVITTVKSKQDQPFIDVCGSNRGSCFVVLGITSVLKCFIRSVRPEVNLEWFARTSKGDRNISFAANVTEDGITFTSNAVISNFLPSKSPLHLLVCKADSPPGILRQNEMLVLVENGNITAKGKPTEISIKRGHELKLVCSKSKVDMIVWRKLGDPVEILSNAVLFQDNFSHVYSDEHELDVDGSLIVWPAEIKHEGIYECSFGGSTFGGKKHFHVVVYDQPSNKPKSGAKLHLLWLLLFIALVTAVVCAVIRKRRVKPKWHLLTSLIHIQSCNNAENGSGDFKMTQKSVDAHQSDPKLQTLKEELKAMYEIQYGSIQPTSNKLCVNSIFVDCGYKLMTSKSTERKLDSWENVETLKEVLQRIDTQSVVIIEGGPGSGKSTLALQLAYDWCNGVEDSPIHDKDILILLRLRDVGGVESVYKAIKDQILARDSSLSETDIRILLGCCNSGVLILDGFDEYPDLSNESKSDIMSIVRGEMFQRYLVIITTRSYSLIKTLPPKSHRIKLAGFDDKTRDQYIRNVVAECDQQMEKKIKQCLHNVLITELLENPLLFTTSAHISSERGGFKIFLSLSSTVKFMINCFHKHMERKMLKKDHTTVKSFKKAHKELDDIAFQIVRGKHKPTWRKDKICQQLGKEFYNYYKRVGILVENVDYNCALLRPITEVQFFHELLCEWFAAHCLVRKFEESELGVRDIEAQLFKMKTVCLLGSGISADFAEKTVKYLLESPDHVNFASLCFVESVKKIDKISDAVNKRVASEMILDIDQDKLLTWSTIHLLMVASRNEMPIPCLQLNAYKSPVEFSDGALILQADICLPYLTTLKELVIYEFVDMQTTDETHILKYSSMCENIASLKFYRCNVAKSMIQEACLTSLKSRKVSVEWVTLSSSFSMNLQSGLWENREGIPLTEEKYAKEVEDIQHHLGPRPSTSRDGEDK